MHIIRCRKTYLVRFANNREHRSISNDFKLFLAIFGREAGTNAYSLPLTIDGMDTADLL